MKPWPLYTCPGKFAQGHHFNFLPEKVTSLVGHDKMHQWISMVSCAGGPNSPCSDFWEGQPYFLGNVTNRHLLLPQTKYPTDQHYSLICSHAVQTDPNFTAAWLEGPKIGAAQATSWWNHPVHSHKILAQCS